ncbi:MAG: methyltransferase domain-containing protein, partial [Verrucomicrobia bacterium]|nr:methyltransferase domain-containing protein [Verrucomicrobiota bacterium]
MISPFREYAQYYDLLYQDKDYAGEARFVARLLGQYVGKPEENTAVLDLACGTGRHAQELARMGYRVEGSDLSVDMVAVARERAKSP